MRSGYREVLAGAAGYLVFVVSSVALFNVMHFDPYAEVSTTFKVMSVAAGIVFALFSGYLTAALSPTSPGRPVIFVALLIAVIAILSLLTAGSGGEWSQLAALLLMSPSVLVGGQLRRRHMNKARARAEVMNGGA